MGDTMPRFKWTGRIDEKLVALVREQADAFERSEAFIVESALREVFKNKLPPGWKPGAKAEQMGTDDVNG
jgi:hypothetical protein